MLPSPTDSGGIVFFGYGEPYRPTLHRIELGAGVRFETPEGAIYSNVVIGVRE